MNEVENLLADLKQKRDELAVQIKLGTMEAKQEWEELETKFNEFSERAKVEESAEGIKQALTSLGDEIKKGYERVSRAL